MSPSLRTGCLLAVSLLTFGPGCGPVEEGPWDPTDEPGTIEQAAASANGLSFNGLSFNGMSSNGLSFNGLSFNGLSSRGLTSSQFGTWFQTDPALADMVMRYVVRCAVPAGQTRSYLNPRTGRTYAWAGLLGLAPDWAQGQQATTAEQQVVSACLAAHTTNTGNPMAISVLGLDGRGQSIPYTQAELAAFSQHEACFFGNLFTGEGVYVASDQGLLRGSQSSPRGCALSPGPLQRVEDNCPPIVPLGSCDVYCESGLLKPYHSRCSYRGRSYRPVTTRLRSQDVFHCGDGVCQPTESCGLGVTYRDCLLDCGLCL
ncbi:hypothetical protein [Pyxidicoccus xibeiensis]|uniref:hypothetical protein n=1 Tax=Pyxidicoccus xibeiensis TaxID=2906759 RepID=UPI0020A76C64|nr:hypothetical protein [Pyxidicoccus xibeiensis]MCP3139713.1 hypothetical protein [Pyxidicoccus xibeiensis]